MHPRRVGFRHFSAADPGRWVANLPCDRLGSARPVKVSHGGGGAVGAPTSAPLARSPYERCQSLNCLRHHPSAMR